MDDHSKPRPADDDLSSGVGNSEQEARRQQLRAAVKLGLEDIESGRVVDLEAAFDRIEAMLDELEATRRG